MKKQSPFLKTTSRVPSVRGMRATRRAQRGAVVLFFSLIVLVILLVGGVVVMRMTNAALFGAGNLAFRRDLVTQSDVVIATAAKAIGTGGTVTDRTQSQPSANYSAAILPTDTQGIPIALLTNSGFTSYGQAKNDLIPVGATAGTGVQALPRNSNVTIRYLIDRLCSNTGAVTTANCVQVQGMVSGGGTASPTPPPPPPGGAVYRLSALVTGPRGTQAFFQTTFSGPS